MPPPLQRPPPARRLKTPEMHYVPKFDMSLSRLLVQCIKGKQQSLGDSVLPTSAKLESDSVPPRPSVDTQDIGEARKQSKSVERKSHTEVNKPSVRSRRWGGGGGGAISAIKRAMTYYQQDAQPQSRNDMDMDPEPPVSAGMPSLPSSSPPSMTGFMQQQLASNGDDAMSEYERKQQQHPRLRWPRLVSQDEAEAWLSGHGIEGVEALPKGNATHTNRAENKAEPEEDAVSLLSGGSDVLVMGVPARHNRSAGTASSFRSSRGIDTPVRPAVLPRSVSYQQCPSGVISTLHVPDEQWLESQNTVDAMTASTTSFRSGFNQSSRTSFMTGNSQTRSSKNQSKLVDRKWFMRMAPISCLPSEPVSKSARRATTEAALFGQENGFDVGGDCGEYLSFEKWGVDDDYVECLLSSHCNSSDNSLRGLRYLNLSGNRLTETGVLKLKGYGLPTNLLSLNLAANGFGELGGHSVVELAKSCRYLKELDLSRNVIGDAVVEELCNVLDHLCTDLEGLGLGSCGLGSSPRGGIGIGYLLSAHAKLKSLDVSWNEFHGPGAHALLKGLHNNSCSLSLARLNLAWNRLGSGYNADQKRKDDAERSARLLGNVFSDGDRLFHIDISYNGFIADHCGILAAGLLHNHTLFGIHLVGNEATVDDLGFVIPLNAKPLSDPDTPGESAGQRLTSDTGLVGTAVPDEVSDVEASEAPRRLMNDMSRSVHSGLKYENRKVARGVRSGKSMGFGKLYLNPSLNSLELENAECFSEEDLRMEHQWVDDNACIQTCADWAKNEVEAPQCNLTHCWICENWVEHHVSYHPGISGADQDVSSVYALFSIDGFQRPTKLRYQEESQRKSLNQLMMRSGKRVAALKTLKRLFGSDFSMPDVSGNADANSLSRSTSIFSGAGKNPLTAQGKMSDNADAKSLSRSTSIFSGAGKNLLTAKGKVAKWVGVRMLPPTTEPIQVVFIVDGQVVVAKDLPKQKLPKPKVARVHMGSEGRHTFEIQDVNMLMVGSTAWEMFKRGRHRAVCVLEDPANRGAATLVPRTLPDMIDQERPSGQWTLQDSVFKDYVFDSSATDERCFDKDWSSSRLDQILKKDDTRTQIFNFLQPRYLDIMLCFMNWAFMGFNVNSPVACVNMDDFRNFMITLGGEGPGRLIDGNYCKASDTDCVFVAANVVDRAKRSQFKVLPDKGLTRFQFLEGVVRLSLRRFLTSPASSSTTSSCIAAIKGFFDLTHMGQNLRDQRKTFQDALFNEECCMIYREHLDTLKGIYEGYKTILPNPGRSGKAVSYAAWLHMLTEANVINENFTREMCGAAFALAKEIHTDVNSDWRLMELTWSEFLLSLAAVVRLSPAWDREFFSDFLDEFFTEHLEEAYSKLLSKNPGTQKVFKNVDPALQPMVNFLSGIFEDADDNNSGTVDIREFKRALKPPRVKAEMHHLGFNLSDVEVLFRTIDLDNKGEVTVDKLVDGFVKMKTAMRGMEKAMNFVRKSFAEADKDANGVLDDHEFHELFKQPAILKKLQVLGVNLDDVEDLFAIVDKEGQGQVAVEEIIRGFVALRDPETRVVRGMRLLRQLFDEADSDGNGSLDLHQVESTLAQTEVEQKFKHLQLAVPNWSTLFEELDTDGSGDLDWEEIQQGMTGFWSTSLK